MEQASIDQFPHPQNLIRSVFGTVSTVVDDDQFIIFNLIGVNVRLRMEDIGYHFIFSTQNFRVTHILPYTMFIFQEGSMYLFRERILSIMLSLTREECKFIQRRGKNDADLSTDSGRDEEPSSSEDEDSISEG